MRVLMHLKPAHRGCLVAAGVAVLSLAGASPAFAGTPWWHLVSRAAPTYLQPGSEGLVTLTAANLGDGTVDGETNPITIVDTLPPGLQAMSIGANSGIGITQRGPVNCQLKSLTCTFTGTLPPYDQIEVRIGVKVGEGEGAALGGLNEVSVTGGETRGASNAHPVVVSEESIPFGLQDDEFTPEEEGGGPDTQAGSHPFQLTNTVVFNQRLGGFKGGFSPTPVDSPKDVEVRLPPGLVGNPTPFPRCSVQQFLSHIQTNESPETVNLCPAQTAVGVATVMVVEPEFAGLLKFTVPVFNLEPGFGEPARFGFYIGAALTPVYLDTSVRDRDGEDYGITVSALNISQTADFLSSEVTFWGTPSDPRHDPARGWGCLWELRNGESGGNQHSCKPLAAKQRQSLLTLPTSCTGSPPPSSTEVDSWAQPLVFSSLPAGPPVPVLDGCNRLPFSPTVEAEPTTDRASAPSGLNVNLDFHDEGLTSAEGLAQSQLKKVVVILPEGLTINPSAGVGLRGCTPAEYASETVESSSGAGCPNDSKLGTVTIETPLLTVPIHGSLYIAEPYNNPSGSLVALYIVAKNPEVGVLVKLAGKVSADPVTGRLTTTFDNNPQLPFDHFNFHFREGQQAPLISPSTCGVYSTQAQLTPWSEPITTLEDTSLFTITKGFEGGACPSGGVPPFSPGIEAGSLNNNAGSYSPFYVHLTRSDGDQEIAGFSTDLPEGLTGDLSGIPFCSEADIALARTKTGRQEEAEPSCPAASQIGHTLVGTGVGAVLAYVPGKIYLAGPFHGDPFSIVSVTSAVVGPFDLGTVVLRFALKIDPYTAKVSVDPSTSEPIPTIIQGIVTHVRDIRVYIDRPHFTLNPTSCDALAIGSTLTSNLGQSATVTSPYQASNCQGLPFQPQFSVSTSGKTSRANGASLAVKLGYPSGTQANIAKVKVELPKALPSRLTTLQKACRAAQFESNPAGCPTASVVGHARATTPILPVPLEGPAYFVSHGGEAFPSLVIVLQGYGVTVNLVGSTFINERTGITSSTFKTVPDVPVGTFELTLPEGPFSALAATANLCKQKLAMPTEFVAQNGEVIHQSTKIAVTGCGKAKKSSHKHRKRKAKRTRKAKKRR